jgi:ATP-binding cassette subfamily B protein
MSRGSTDNRRLIVPEVVQSSAMDCGPAALKCCLEGFGVRVSYGRLREACQTDVDGTSIDTLEDVAVQLGLRAEQMMVPADHLLLRDARCLPAIVVLRLPSGVTHFAVAWRRHGPFIQVMDPGTGRRWPTCRSFLENAYIHSFPVAAAAWREWAGSEDFLAPLRQRLKAVGLSNQRSTAALDSCLEDRTWHALAALDASVRLLAELVRTNGVSRGRQSARVFEALLERARRESSGEAAVVPESFWSVRATAPGPEGEERLLLRGVVIVRVRGRREAKTSTTRAQTMPEMPVAQRLPPEVGPLPEPERESEPAPLSPELIAALAEPPSRPALELWRLVRDSGRLAPAVLVTSLTLAAAGVLFEALLFRGIIDLGRDLGLASQRLAALGALLALGAILLLLEVPIASGVVRLGRHLEVRLRLAFLEKLPRLGDRYFRSRIQSDMAERSHSLQVLRHLPDLGGRLVRAVLQLVLTAAGIVWLDPRSAPLAIAAGLVAVAIPLLLQPVLAERDMRLRTHSGALGRFYLDALLGLIPVRSHGAERAVRREHENLLVEWARAGLRLQRAEVAAEGLQFLLGFGLAAWLLFDHLAREAAGGSVLLLVYWALNLPFLGQEIALAARQYPEQRNVTLRLLELLAAPEEIDTPETEPRAPDIRDAAAHGASICFDGVSVRAAGHTILDGIDLEIHPGDHIAIVGPSGAGKSSLVGLLLGWHRAATGRVLADGVPLRGEKLARLRLQRRGSIPPCSSGTDPSSTIWSTACRPLDASRSRA